MTAECGTTAGARRWRDFSEYMLGFAIGSLIVWVLRDDPELLRQIRSDVRAYRCREL
jgi:hypothetical protein